MGDILPVVISIFDDRTFTFIVKTPPVAFLIKKMLKLKVDLVKDLKKLLVN